MNPLTDREREIALYVAAGLTTRMISHRMRLSASTIERHKSTLMRSVDAGNMQQAVIILLQSGVIQLDEIPLPHREQERERI